MAHITHLASLVSLLVVFSHAQGRPNPDEGPAWILAANSFLNGMIGLLRMPLFFAISGYLFMHTNPPGKTLNYWTFINKKIVRLFIPFLAITMVALPIKAMLSDHALRPTTFTLDNFALALIHPLHNPIIFFWFLSALFTIFLAAPAMRLVLLRNPLMAVTVGTAVALVLRWWAIGGLPFIKYSIPSWFALQPAASCTLYFWIGMLAWLWRDRWSNALRPSVALLGLFLVVGFYAIVQEQFTYWRAVIVVLGMYSTYFMVDQYVQRGWTFLRWLDGKTFQIYLLAWFPQQFVMIVLYKILGWNYWLCFFLMFTGGLLLPLLARYLVDRYMPAASILLGFKSRRSSRQVAPEPFLQPVPVAQVG